MVIKVSVTEDGCDIEVPGKTALPWAVAAVKAIKNDELLPSPSNGQIIEVTNPPKRLSNKPEAPTIEEPAKPQETILAEAAQPVKRSAGKPVSKEEKTFPSEEESKRTAKVLIESNQSFYLSKVSPYQTETKRKRFMKWLTNSFQVDIVPKTAGKPINNYNPYIVQPYVFERAGVKKYAPMPWEFENEAVKGAGIKPAAKKRASEASEPEDADTFAAV